MASASLTNSVAVALCLLPALVLAQPALSGPYRMEPLGRLELRSDGDRLLGITTSENACNFEGRKRVLEGAFEGSVLVGTLTLCQTGPSCAPEQAYPVLAIHHAADGSLSAYVRLKPGCQSPMLLKGGRLVLTPGAAEEVRGEGEAGGSSASSVARKRDKRQSSEAVASMLKEGEAFYLKGEYVLATRRFEAVLSLDENNPMAYHSLGAAQLLRKNAPEAIKALEKARSLGHAHKYPEMEYLLACAYGQAGQKEKGREALRRAVRRGYRVDAGAWEKDADLRNLMGSEAEFHAFLKQQQRARKQVESERQDPPDP
jgi:tetratricopeptide (TPR) repeat protein